MADRLRIKGYRVERRLSRGGLGSIHLGRRGKRPVAIKVFDIDLDEVVARDSFERETAALARLSGHPHVVPMLDHGLTRDHRPFLVTNYYARGTLADRLRTKGPLAVTDSLRLMTQLIDALRAAHEASIVHRDVKPSNILFDDSGRAMLGDFGIAAVGLSGEATLAGAWVSPAYVAPEVIEGSEATAESDLYSAGATLYAMLTGEAPFGSVGTVFGQMRAARQLPAPTVDRDDVPADLIVLLDELLTKDPAGRPRSAEAVATRLESICDDYGFDTTSELAVRRPLEPRVSRLRVTALASLAVVLVAGIATGLVGAVGTTAASNQPTTTNAGRDRPVTTTPRSPNPSGPAGLIQPVLYDGGEDTTPEIRDVLDEVALAFLPTDWNSPPPTDSNPPGIDRVPARFSYYFVNNRKSPACETFFGWEFRGTGAIHRTWHTARTMVSIKTFASAVDAHAYFTGMSLELGADPGDCRGMPQQRGRPPIGGPEDLAEASIDHDELAIEPGGYDEINSWRRPSQVIEGYMDSAVIARDGNVIAAVQVVEPPLVDPTAPLDHLMSFTHDALGRHLR